MSKTLNDLKDLKRLLKDMSKENPVESKSLPQKRRNRTITIKPPKEKSPIPIGSRVALMNFTEKGTLRSFSDGIYTIDLDDGISIPAKTGEFVVIESEAYKNAVIRPLAKDTKTQEAYCNEISVDLHISAITGGRKVEKNQCLSLQIELFKSTINMNLCHKGRKIHFIHGHGEGILRREIIKLLDEVYPLRCTYNSSDFAIVTVIIK